MNTCAEQITDTILDSITNELKKKKTKDKIMTGIVDPLICDITARYYPHFITMTCVSAMIIILLIIILVLLISQKIKNK